MFRVVVSTPYRVFLSCRATSFSCEASFPNGELIFSVKINSHPLKGVRIVKKLSIRERNLFRSRLDKFLKKGYNRDMNTLQFRGCNNGYPGNYRGPRVNSWTCRRFAASLGIQACPRKCRHPRLNI